jgi:hypothetical protein
MNIIVFMSLLIDFAFVLSFAFRKSQYFFRKRLLSISLSGNEDTCPISQVCEQKLPSLVTQVYDLSRGIKMLKGV